MHNLQHLNKSLLIALAVLATLGLATPVRAQNKRNGAPSINPGFPGNFGPFLTNQIYLPEAVGPFEAGYNPATLDLAIAYKLPTHLVFDHGQLDLRQGFGLNWEIPSLVTRTGERGALRLSGLLLSSNRASYATIAPYEAKVSGQGVEIAYAYRLVDRPSSKLTLGLAYSPYNKIETSLSKGGREIATGDIETTLQGRVGLLWQDDKGTRIGLAGSIERFNQSIRYGGSDQQSQTTQTMVVVGASHRFSTGTTLYANRLWFKLESGDFRLKTTGHTLGVNQELGKRWIVGLDHTGKGLTASLVYLGNGWNAYVAHGDRNFSHTEGIFGERGSFTGVGVTINLK